MSEVIAMFEAELKNKLLFKSSAKVTSEAYLFKAFKFFDLFNNGYLNKKDFFKAIAKCGVVVDTYNIDALYDHYDTDKSGTINYKYFIENLFINDFTESSEMSQTSLSFKKSQPKQSRVQEAKQISRYQESQYSRKQPLSYEQIFEIVQQQLRANGICGLINFANALKAQDHHRTHLITPQKLRSSLPFLSQQNIEKLVDNFHPNKFQQINYAELIYSIKGNMIQKRQRLIDELFEFLDNKREGEIQISKLLHSFKNKHMFHQFKQAIDAYQNFQSIDDGIFTDEDFNDFFEFISFSLIEDAQFEQFIRVGFYDELSRSVSSRSSRQRQFASRKQPQKQSESNYGDFRKVKKQESSPISNIVDSPKQKLQMSDHDERKSVSSRRSEIKSVDTPVVRQVEMVLLRMKKRLASKGTRGFLLFEKSLKHYDTDEDGLINLDQFKAVIKDQKVDITSTETITIFSIFRNQTKGGLVDYQQIVQTLKGQPSNERKQLISRIWQRVQLDQQNTNFSKIKNCLNFRNHPDVQTGRRYEDEIFTQIKDSILMIQDLNGSPRSDVVSKDVFFEYCQNLSLSIPENQLFESIVMNFWKVQSNSRIDEQYAGSRKLFDPSYKGYLQDHHRYAIKGGSVTDNAPFGTFHGPTNYTTEHQRL